jgi:hypothetical protein
VAAAGGQVLPVAVALLGVCGLSLVVLYDFGQTVAARARLTNAADAAAHAGALVQARTLNMLAYINRAQVAHQVAMAHLVTLASWLQFGQNEMRSLLAFNPPVFVIGAHFGPAHAMAYSSAGSATGTLDAGSHLARAHAEHERTVHDVLARAGDAVLRSMPSARDQAMLAVLAANYPELPVARLGAGAPGEANPLALEIVRDDWPGLVRRHAANAGGPLRPLVLQAIGRYGFLQERRGLKRSLFPVSERCPEKRHELRRLGATRLDQQGIWTSKDTQSYHALRSNKYTGCYFREYAMGWGLVGGLRSGSFQGPGQDIPENFSRQAYWRWVREHTDWDIIGGRTNPMAEARAFKGSTRWDSRGLPAHMEIERARMHAPVDLQIRLRQSGASLQVHDGRSALGAPLGRMRYEGLGRHGVMTVRSAAQTHFVRPAPRHDGREEVATLFRPYWQARLTAARDGRPGATHGR